MTPQYEYVGPPADQETEESLLPWPPVIPDPPAPNPSSASGYFGVNVLNYTEQGGTRTVIGGELAFEKGAKVSDLPTNAAYYDLDLGGVDVLECISEPLDVSEQLPLDTFVEASEGRRPVLFRNGILNERQISVVSCSAQYEDYIVGLCPILMDLSGLMSCAATFLLFVEGDKVFFRVNLNDGKGDFADPEPPPEEFVKREVEEAQFN